MYPDSEEQKMRDLMQSMIDTLRTTLDTAEALADEFRCLIMDDDGNKKDIDIQEFMHLQAKAMVVMMDAIGPSNKLTLKQLEDLLEDE